MILHNNIEVSSPRRQLECRHLTIVSKHLSPKLIEKHGAIHKSTIIIRDLHTPFSIIDRSSRKKKISKDIVDLNSTINQLDPNDIYRTLHTKTAEYTFFSSLHRLFTKIDHTIGHKRHLNRFKRIGIIQNMFFNHNGIKLEMNNIKIVGKSQNIWRLKNTCK